MYKIQEIIIMNSTLALPKWVRAKIIVAIFGYSQDAIAKKRQQGIWLEGKVWRKAPDNTLMYSPDAIDNWIENGSNN